MHKGQDGWCPNWMFRECYAIRYALQQLGHRSDVWGLRHANFEQVPDLGAYDAVFVVENYEFSWLPDLSAAKKVFFWMIDAHVEPVDRYNAVLCQSHVVLHSSRHYMPVYEQAFPAQRHIYFPNGVDSRFFNVDQYPVTLRTKPLIFIGGRGISREHELFQMEHEAGLKYGIGITGEDYVKALLAAKMQFNKPSNRDINYRTWETTGMGCCLLTEYDPELEALGFYHGSNCLFYHTIDEAVKLAKKYLENGEWAHVAAGGCELAKFHSYTARMHALLKRL